MIVEGNWVPGDCGGSSVPTVTIAGAVVVKLLQVEPLTVDESV